MNNYDYTFPFRGFQPFVESDSKQFHGREHEIQEIAGHLRSSRVSLTIVHGQPGCGKTSILRAGLIPALERRSSQTRFLRISGREEGPTDSLAEPLFLRATGYPLEELARVLAAIRPAADLEDPIGEDRASAPNGESDEPLTRQLAEEWVLTPGREPRSKGASPLRGALAELERVSRATGTTKVIIIDQAEEPYTIGTVESQDEWHSFLAHFCELHHDTKLLLSMRTEFVGRLLSSIQAMGGEVKRARLTYIPQLTDEDIEHILRQIADGGAVQSRSGRDVRMPEAAVSAVVQAVKQTGNVHSKAVALQVIGLAACLRAVRRIEEGRTQLSAARGEFATQVAAPFVGALEVEPFDVATAGASAALLELVAASLGVRVAADGQSRLRRVSPGIADRMFVVEQPDGTLATRLRLITDFPLRRRRRLLDIVSLNSDGPQTISRETVEQLCEGPAPLLRRVRNPRGDALVGLSHDVIARGIRQLSRAADVSRRETQRLLGFAVLLVAIVALGATGETFVREVRHHRLVAEAKESEAEHLRRMAEASSVDAASARDSLQDCLERPKEDPGAISSVGSPEVSSLTRIPAHDAQELIRQTMRGGGNDVLGRALKAYLGPCQSGAFRYSADAETVLLAFFQDALVAGVAPADVGFALAQYVSARLGAIAASRSDSESEGIRHYLSAQLRYRVLSAELLASSMAAVQRWEMASAAILDADQYLKMNPRSWKGFQLKNRILGAVYGDNSSAAIGFVCDRDVIALSVERRLECGARATRAAEDRIRQGRDYCGAMALLKTAIVALSEGGGDGQRKEKVNMWRTYATRLSKRAHRASEGLCDTVVTPQ